jgi:hypothetical protein
MSTTRIAVLTGAALAAGVIGFTSVGSDTAAGAGCRRHPKRCEKALATTTTTTTTTTTAAPATAAASGTVTLTDKAFVCAGPVHLTSVSVTMKNVSGDAVFLRKGCTGTIGRIDIVQFHGDGIKLGAAHDLTIGGGSIRCYAHDALKHQDGVQILGGTNVSFRNLDVGCYSANNSQVWINDGNGSGPGGLPTNVVFDGGRFQGLYSGGRYGPGGSYGVAIVNSVGSGVRNATVCPNAHPQRALYVAAGAQSPVTSGTKVATGC